MSEASLTETAKEELVAAMYKIKYSENEIECTEAAKYVLNHHMDHSSLSKVLRDHSVGIMDAKNSGEQADATALANKTLLTMIAQLFTNTFRMGMIEQQAEYRKLLESELSKQPAPTIGTPAP